MFGQAYDHAFETLLQSDAGRRDHVSTLPLRQTNTEATLKHTQDWLPNNRRTWHSHNYVLSTHNMSVTVLGIYRHGYTFAITHNMLRTMYQRVGSLNIRKMHDETILFNILELIWKTEHIAFSEFATEETIRRRYNAVKFFKRERKQKTGEFHWKQGQRCTPLENSKSYLQDTYIVSSHRRNKPENHCTPFSKSTVHHSAKDKHPDDQDLRLPACLPHTPPLWKPQLSWSSLHTYKDDKAPRRDLF